MTSEMNRRQAFKIECLRAFKRIERWRSMTDVQRAKEMESRLLEGSCSFCGCPFIARPVVTDDPLCPACAELSQQEEGRL